MSQVIKIKHSTTTGNKPASLASGELAINVSDGNLFFGDGSNVQNYLHLGTTTASTASITKTLVVTGQTDLHSNLVMNSNKITSLLDPTAAQDAATKAYVDSQTGGAISNYLPLSGGTMSGVIAMGTNKVTGVGNPTLAQDAATKAYVDQYATSGVSSVAISGSDGIQVDSGSPITSSGTIALGLSAIDATKIADGTVTNTEFQFINSLSSNAQNQITDNLNSIETNTVNIGTKLPLAGGTVTGALNVSGVTSFGSNLVMDMNKITGVANPTSAQDAATKGYVDGLSGATDNFQEVTNNGNTTTNAIGIGSSVAPSYQLDVTGDIHSSTVIRSSGLYSTFGSFSSNINANGNIIGDGATNITGINNITATGAVSISGLTSVGDNIIMNSNKITSLLNPTALQDAATKSYVDSFTPNGLHYLPLSGGTVTGALNVSGNTEVGGTLRTRGGLQLGADNAVSDYARINFGTPGNKNFPQFKVTEVNQLILDRGGDTATLVEFNTAQHSDGPAVKITGDIDLGSAYRLYLDSGFDTYITDGGINNNISLYVNNTNIVNFKQPGTVIATPLNVSGATDIDGTLNVNANLITNVTNPTSAQDAATKAYVDQYATSGVSSVAALTLGTSGTDLSSTVANGTTTPVITLNVPTASASNRGVLLSSDWTTFNNKTTNTGTVESVSSTTAGDALDVAVSNATTTPAIALTWAGADTQYIDGAGDLTTFPNIPQGDITAITVTSPITGGGTAGSVGIAIQQSSGSQSGYLSSTDWTTFNNKTTNTGTVTGTGVNNRLAIWNGTTAIDSDSDFYVDTETLFAKSLTTIGAILTGSDGNSSQWNDAYNNQVTAIGNSGTSTVTLTLTQSDGGTLTTSFANPQGTMSSFNVREDNTGTPGSSTNVTNGGTLTFGGGIGIKFSVPNENITADIDLNELATSTTNTDGDFFVVVDSADGSQHKLTKGNINNSGFNNDANYTTNLGTVTSVASTTAGDALDVAVSNSTTTPAIALTWAGSSSQYIDGAGDLTTFPTLPVGDVTAVLSGSGIVVTNSSGPEPSVAIDYVGTNNAILVAATATPVSGDNIWFSDADDNTIKKATISSFPGFGKDGTVTSVGAITLGTSGTDLSSSVANGTTTPVITLNVPTASASNRGALSSSDWSTFNSKTTNLGTVTSVSSTTAGDALDVAVSNSTTTPAIALTWAGADTEYIDGEGNLITFPSIPQGDITAITVTSPITGGGTSGSVGLGIQVANTSQSGYLSSTDWNTFNNKTTNTGTVTSVAVSGSDGIDVDSGSPITTNGTIALGLSDVPNSSLENSSVTVSPGTLLDNGGSVSLGGSITLDVNLSELATSTSDGDGDFFAVIDSANAQKKLTKGNINNSGFNNDAGYTTNAGTVTSVASTTAGDALDVSVSNASTTPAIALSWAGADTQYIDGEGNLTTFPTIPAGDVTAVSGGTYITTTSTTGPVPIVNHDATSRTDTTSTASPAHGATFTAVDSVSTNATGHITALNLKTVTLPADAEGVTSVSGTAPVVSSGGNTPTISMAVASTSANGYLSSTDWNTFNSKTTNLGTVTSVSSTTGGDALDVAVSNATTTPAIALSWAGDDTEYIDGAGDLTTFPNIPQGDITAITVSSPITGGGTSGSVGIAITQSSASANGYLSSTDWSTFNSKTTNTGTVTSVAALTLGTSGTDLSSTVANGSTSAVVTLNVPTASASNRGALSSSDWTTFNNKTTNTGTVTSVSSSTAGNALDVAVSNSTTTPAIALTWDGSSSQYIDGAGNLTTFPSIPAGDVTAVLAGDGVAVTNPTGPEPSVAVLYSTVVRTSGTQSIAGLKTFTGEMLDVTGEDPRVRLYADAGNHPGFELYDGTTRKWIIYNDPNDTHNLNIKDDGNDRVSITQTGKVGIGITNPATTLDVVGDIKASTIVNASSDTDKFLVSDSGVVKFRTGAEVRGDIGAGTGSGTVTSVAVSGSDGIDVDSGSPITTNGTIALGLSNVPNTSLANSSVTITAGGGLTDGGSVALGASTELQYRSRCGY